MLISIEHLYEIRKMQKVLHCDEERAISIVDKLHDVIPELKSCYDKWLNGQEENYEHNGLTLFTIMKKDNCTFAQAILRMDILVKDTVLEKMYLDSNYARM